MRETVRRFMRPDGINRHKKTIYANKAALVPSLRQPVKAERPAPGEFVHEAFLLKPAEKSTGRMTGDPEGLCRLVGRYRGEGDEQVEKRRHP